VELMKSELAQLQDELKEKEILILNERHLLEEQAKKIHTLERYEQILEMKSKEIVKKY
jgi:Rad3-related DNA helicase